jgi:hypothetical protein
MSQSPESTCIKIPPIYGIKKAVIIHGLFVLREKQKSRGAWKRFSTASSLFNGENQRWTNPSLLFLHHQLFPIEPFWFIFACPLKIQT